MKPPETYMYGSFCVVILFASSLGVTLQFAAVRSFNPSSSHQDSLDMFSTA